MASSRVLASSALPRRLPFAFVAVVAGVALPGCGGRELSDEPAVAVAGSGIPVGARNAEGVRFDPPPVIKASIGDDDELHPPKPKLPKIPPSPFGPEEIPEIDGPDDGGAAPHHLPKPTKKGTQL